MQRSFGTKLVHTRNRFYLIFRFLRKIVFFASKTLAFWLKIG